MKHLRLAFALTAFFLGAQLAEGQIMQSQVYTYFMKAERFHQMGKDSAAIASLNELVELIPEFPLTYLRQGNIYYDMYQSKPTDEALNGAVFMYRKYLTLEFKESLIKEPSERLRRLETLLNVAHFEEEEKKDSQEDLAQEDIQVITDAESAKMITVTPAQSQETKIVELVPLVAQAEVAPAQSSEVKNPVVEGLIPQLGKPKFSYLSLYDIQLPTAPIVEENKVTALSAQNLVGHWVTETMQSKGRVMWAFDIQEDGMGGYYVVFSDESGIVHPTTNDGTAFRRTMSFLKKYLQKTKLISDRKYEVLIERTKAKVEGNAISFTFDVEEQYIASSTLRKWSKNMINNLHSILPFGYSINNYVNNYVDKKNNEDRTKNATVSYTFVCHPKTEDIMDCKISNVRNSQNEYGKQKSKVGKTTTCNLLKTLSDNVEEISDEDYTSNEIGDFKELFDEVKADAAQDINYNYPLAYLYFYGVGIKKDVGKAVEYMNALASVKEDTRAKIWLSNYFYHKAYTDDTKNIFTRRKYVKSALYWSNLMHDLKMKEWYGVKGDMCTSDQDRDISSVMQDSALYYYKLGDEAGDLYSTYRLGSIYMQSNKKQQEAERLLMKAANQGNEDAILELAHLALRRQDLNAYLNNLRLAADLGCPEAYEELGRAYSEGSSYGFRLDPLQGIRMKKYAIHAMQDDWIPVLLSFGYNIDSYLYK